MDHGPPSPSAEPRGEHHSLPFLSPAATGWRGSRVTTLVAYGLTVLAFAVVLIAIEVSLGDPLVPARTPGASHSFEDACWHLGTGLALAVPARRWTAAWMGAIMTLGLDTDHVFGDVLPTVVGRTDHCVFFLVGAAGVLYLIQGRTAGLLVAGAFAGHVALDGGSFALFAPASTATYVLPLPVTVGGIFAAVLLFYLAFRAPRELLRPIDLSLVVVVGVACVAAFLVFTSAATFLFN